MADWQLCKRVIRLWKIRYQVMQAQFLKFALDHEIKRQELDELDHKEDIVKIEYLMEELKTLLGFVMEMGEFIPKSKEVEKELEDMKL